MVPETTDPAVAITARRDTGSARFAIGALFGVLVSAGMALLKAGLSGFTMSGAIEDMSPHFMSPQRFEHVGTAFVVAGALALVAVIVLRRLVRNWWVVAAVAILSLPISTIVASELMFEIVRRLI